MKNLREEVRKATDPKINGMFDKVSEPTGDQMRDWKDISSNGLIQIR